MRGPELLPDMCEGAEAVFENVIDWLRIDSFFWRISRNCRSIFYPFSL